jgi:hypothetical protein
MLNAYESPQAANEPDHAVRPLSRDRRFGPPMYVVLGAVLGAFTGILLLVPRVPFGYLLFVPGALAGGVIFRIRSRHWPVDPGAKLRHRAYALLTTVGIPATIALFAGLQGQGKAMALLGLLIGAALGAGILISGNRRSRSHTGS